MLTRGKSPELYRSGQFLPYYFSSRRREELPAWIGWGLLRRLSLRRRLAGWHGASCQRPRGRGSVGGDTRPPQPGSWGSGAQGLISRIVISARVLTGVINGL